MLFIIFGTRVRQSPIGEGQFVCPSCHSQRTYTKTKATRWFTLYFLPVIPLGTVGEYVQCQTCGVTFKPAVLDMKVQPQVAQSSQRDLASLINTVPQRLAEGQSVEYVVRDLTGAGVDRDAALAMLKPHLSNGTMSCESCGLTYAAGVKTCSQCNNPTK